MNELLFQGVTHQRPRGPAVASVIFHAAIIGALIVPGIASLPVAPPPPQPPLEVRLLEAPMKAFRVEPAGIRPLVSVAEPEPEPVPTPVPVSVITGGFSRASVATDQLQLGNIETGAFDRANRDTAQRPGYEGAGGVVIGGLSGGTASGGPRGNIGLAGLTDAFTPLRATGMAEPPANQAADQPAQLLSVPAPYYSEEARQLKIAGEVVLEVTLTMYGQVRVIRVVSGLGYGLDEAAIDAVNKTRCSPALKAGLPVDVTATIKVVFKLT